MGNEGPATQAKLTGANGLTSDVAGDLYVSDGAFRVRRVSRDGIITTVAGNPRTELCGGGDTPPYPCLVAGYSGDGGPADRAELNIVRGLAADRVGNLFIADVLNNRVRKVDPEGLISTVAGGGHPTDALGDGGPATEASLISPVDVAIDGEGNLFIADMGHNRIREVIGVAAPGLLAGRPFPNHPGDVNGDGTVDLADINTLLRALLGEITLSPEQVTAADLNGDGTLDLVDARLLFMRVVGL